MEIILKKRPLDVNQVKEVIVRMAPGSVVDNREMPDLNVRHMIAVMLIDKDATFKISPSIATAMLSRDSAISGKRSVSATISS